MCCAVVCRWRCCSDQEAALASQTWWSKARDGELIDLLHVMGARCGESNLLQLDVTQLQLEPG